jgi:membrane protease YdiL (CAAX protease family)
LKKGRITIFEVNIIYLLVAMLLVTLGAYFQSLNIKTGLLITEYILVLLPVIVFIKWKKMSLKKVLKLNKLNLKHGLLVMAITVLIYPVALFFNLIMMTIISLFTTIKSLPVPTAGNFKEYVGLFFIIAISAGICEEIFFRGMLLSVYKKKYKKLAIVITAVMFGIFHFNLQNLLAPTILGLIFGYLVYLTDSIFAGIIGHITNNGLAVTLAYAVNVVSKKLNIYGKVEPRQGMANTMQLFAGTIMIGFVAIITGIFAYLLIKIIKKDIGNRFNDSKFGEINEINIDTQDITMKKNEKMTHYLPILGVVIIYFFISFIQL